jgi:hypothetical protein
MSFDEDPSSCCPPSCEGSDVFDLSRTDTRLRWEGEDGVRAVFELPDTVAINLRGGWSHQELSETLLDLQVLQGKEWWEPVDVIVPAGKKARALVALGYFHQCIPYAEELPPEVGGGARFHLKTRGIKP